MTLKFMGDLAMNDLRIYVASAHPTVVLQFDPSLPPPPQTQLDFWVRQQLAGGKWEEVAYHFCSIDQQEVEAISDMTEKVLLEFSQLCGEFKLVKPIPTVYATILPVVMSRECEVYTQFFSQLGVALMMCTVIGT